MTQCKFDGMTRDQYDANVAYVLSLMQPHYKRVPGLLPDGTPDIMSMLNKAKRKGTAFGIPQFGDMYRPIERPKTGLREAARRRRQQAA